MDKNKKELLKSLANSASTKIDLNKVREDWKKVEQNAKTIYFNEEQADNLINAVEKGKDTEIRDIDVISKIERGSKSLKKLLDNNVKRDSDGRVLLSKDDEWREETEWNEFYNECKCEWDIISDIFQENIKKQNLSKEDVDKIIDEVRGKIKSDDRHCTVEESLEESLKQMKLMREGKMPKRSWDDFRKSMDKTTKKYYNALSNLADNDYKKGE